MLIVTIETLQTSEFAEFIYGSPIYLLAQGNRGPSKAQALVVQNPKKMGHEAVKALVTKMKGETVPTVIDSGAAVITKENLDTPEIQALLACFFAVFA
jgi:ABC-type sugar transport system substrate-binding protein